MRMVQFVLAWEKKTHWMKLKNQIKFFGSGIEDDFVDVTEDGFEYSEDEVEEDIIGDLLNSAISSSNTGLQLESIINSLKTNYFKVPGFQRKFIWTKKQVASLALSIIKDIPIPPLYVYVNIENWILKMSQK